MPPKLFHPHPSQVGMDRLERLQLPLERVIRKIHVCYNTAHLKSPVLSNLGKRDVPKEQGYVPLPLRL